MITDWELNDKERTQQFFEIYKKYKKADHLTDILYITVMSFDMALIKVKNRIIPVCNDSHYIVNGICLPKSQIINERNESIVIMGMGMTAPFGSMPFRLKKGVTVMSPIYDECERLTLLKNLTRIICGHRLIHLSEPLLMASTCSGDSGAPQHQQYGCQAVQISLNSFGNWINSSGCGYKLGWVRVSENIQWIRTEITYEKFVGKIQNRHLRVSYSICPTI